MDKAERVVALLRVGPLRDWATTDGRLDEIAAILRREYQAPHWQAAKEFVEAARRDALEKAENACLEEAEAQHQKASFGLEDDPQTAALNCAAAIRAAREET